MGRVPGTRCGFTSRTGLKDDGTITANEMYCLSDTGAYGCHALTVAGNTGHKAMAIYVGDGEYRKDPNIRFYSDVGLYQHGTLRRLPGLRRPAGILAGGAAYGKHCPRDGS